MTRDRRIWLFLTHVVLLTTVSIPLAMAERRPWYLGLVVIGSALAWFTTARTDRAVLGPRAARGVVLAAFVLLIIEYFWVSSVPPVVALSHFMSIVCVSKLLQPRTLRDDGQILILALLLLVVAAIVSGDLLFPIVLSVYVAVGFTALMRFHLEIERARAMRTQQAGDAETATGPAPAESAARPPLLRVTLTGSAISLVVGIVVFVTCPRIGAGMLGTVDASRASHRVTGFAADLSFGESSPLRQSDQPVMRVVLENEDGTPDQARVPLYFRGTVNDQYWRNPRTGLWGWRRRSLTESDWEHYALQIASAPPPSAQLIPVAEPRHLRLRLVQNYYLEPSSDPYLFACYPAIRISSPDIDRVTKAIPDQVLHVNKPPGEVIRYSLESSRTISRPLVSALESERYQAPAVLLPDPPLEREREIRELIDEVVDPALNLADPEGRMTAVQQLERFLRSEAFAYTLNAQPDKEHGDPTSEFLLDTRRGHCEYSASALALMCQYMGIPARVVNGYLAGDYNPVGDFYVVRARHAHAWVEVYIPEKDWVTFDPTPVAGDDHEGMSAWMLQLNTYVDFAQFHWANLVVAYDDDLRKDLINGFMAWLRRPAQNTDTTIGAVVAFVRELFGWRLKLTWKERLIYWAFSILVVVMAGLLLCVAAILVRRTIRWIRRLDLARGSSPVLPAEAEFYRRFCQRLAMLGLHRHPGETPAEFARGLARRSPVFRSAPMLVEAYYRIVFGGKAVAEAERSQIEAFLRVLKQTHDQPGRGDAD